MITMNSILVIVVSYNSMKWAERCYGSLRESTLPCDILMIDNGSTDGTQDFIRKNYPEVEIIETGDNLGFGKANNIGLQRVIDKKYKYAYLLNQDAWVKPDTFEKLIKASVENPEYGILSPVQVQADEKEIDANLGVLLSKKYGCNFWNDIFFGSSSIVSETKETMAAHWLITRKCIETVGGFSPAFPHYGEDENYIDRAKLHGIKNGVVRNAIAIHDRSQRKCTYNQAIYRVYIMALVRLSQVVDMTFGMSEGKFLKEMIRRSFRGLTIKPYYYIYKFYSHKSQILMYKEMSRQKGAFLNPK